MKCVYQPTGKDGEYRCVNCQHTRVSKYPAQMLHRDCATPGSDPQYIPSAAANEHSFMSELPEESRQLLLGDRVKQLTDALGIPQCGGCARRQQWLNDAHEWALKRWG